MTIPNTNRAIAAAATDAAGWLASHPDLPPIGSMGAHHRYRTGQVEVTLHLAGHGTTALTQALTTATALPDAQTTVTVQPGSMMRLAVTSTTDTGTHLEFWAYLHHPVTTALADVLRLGWNTSIDSTHPVTLDQLRRAITELAEPPMRAAS